MNKIIMITEEQLSLFKDSEVNSVDEPETEVQSDDSEASEPIESRINILVGCEESQAVCEAFRKRGFNAYSCDIKECSGGHPEWHIMGDMFAAINSRGGKLQNGDEVTVPQWDLLIAHPPCTYLTVSGNAWMSHPEDKHLPYDQRRPHPLYPTRRQDREDAAAFFMSCINAPVPCIAVENPVGVMSTRYAKPTQYIQPYYFGDHASKKTGLWLKNLPKLVATDIVEPGEWVYYGDGKRMQRDCYAAAGSKDRQTIRSKTYHGIAEAMASQWGNYLKSKVK